MAVITLLQLSQSHYIYYIQYLLITINCIVRITCLAEFDYDSNGCRALHNALYTTRETKECEWNILEHNNCTPRMSLVMIFVCSIDVWTLHVTVWLSWTIGNTLHSVKFTKQSCIDVRRVPPLPVLLPLFCFTSYGRYPWLVIIFWYVIGQNKPICDWS